MENDYEDFDEEVLQSDIEVEDDAGLAESSYGSFGWYLRGY